MREQFLSKIGFEPDDFQQEAFSYIDAGENVLVAAPTGAGKTLVAEYVVEKTSVEGGRIFYTTPIKALSNQKFRDLVSLYGSENVGLLTGDLSIHPDAPIVVMTTEVLRNMIYAGNSLQNLRAVILDEVHYLQDVSRGAVWEEVIIHVPQHVQLVCLSATVSNVEELRDWLETVRGATGLVVEHTRPVELDSYYYVGERSNSHVHTLQTLRGKKPNREGFTYDVDYNKKNRRQRSHKGSRKRRRWKAPSRLDTVLQLQKKNMLPAIFFIFSRNGCDDAAYSLASSGIALTSPEERTEIHRITKEAVSQLSSEDLALLEFDKFSMALEGGVAPHHAGMVPPFKEIVEKCFSQGFLKVVFATETLALGINMPARTVVVEKLTKFTGETHEFLTPSQFTQLTGRAGRRGIDSRGSAVVLWSPFVSFKQVADLVLSREFVLSSSFRPTYTMAANLVRRHNRVQARQLLNLSFAQFRADARVVRSEQSLEKLRKKRKKLVTRLEDRFGSLEALRRSADASYPADLSEIAFALAQFIPGEICTFTGSGFPPVGVVIATYSRKGGKIRAKVVDIEGVCHEIAPASLVAVPESVGHLDLPEPYLPNSAVFAAEVAEKAAKRKLFQQLVKAKKQVSSPAASREAQKEISRLKKLERELSRSEKSTEQYAGSLGLQFDQVIEILQKYSHIESWSLTARGERLSQLHHESGLFIIEVLEKNIFDGCNRAEFVALASIFCYEERRKDADPEVWFPSPVLRQKFSEIQNIYFSLSQLERKKGVAVTRKPDAGFMALAHGWAAGGSLEDVLQDEGIRPGDFIRTMKQLVDLIRQLAVLIPNKETARVARSSVDAVFRGLVEMSSLVDQEPAKEIEEDDPADDREG